jgi:hypothetical protein
MQSQGHRERIAGGFADGIDSEPEMDRSFYFKPSGSHPEVWVAEGLAPLVCQYNYAAEEPA